MTKRVDEVTRLRGCLDDLGGIMALPALWAGGDPHHIVSTWLDALLRMLPVAFVCVRLNDPDASAPIDMVRVAESMEGTAPDLSVATARLGVRGEIGILVAGSRRLDFPGATDRLLLDVAANQAAAALQLEKAGAKQKRAEEALLERERESRLIVDSIPGLVATLTPAGEVEDVNNRVLEYCGRTLEELKQWGTSDTVHPEDLPRVIEIISQSMASGDPYDIEERIRRFDGVYRWFQVRGFPLRDSNGRIVRWYVLLTDIDARRRAEEALRERERESRLIVDSIPGLVATMTPDGEVQGVNKQVLEYCGQTLEELKQWKTSNLAHPEDLPRAVEVVTRSIASGESYEFEERVRRFDGVYRWFQVRGLPLRDSNGYIVRWYSLLTDIEDRKRAEDDLGRSQAFLAEGLRVSSTGTFSERLDTGEITLSKELRRMYELDQNEASTLERLLGLIHPDDIPMLAEKRKQIQSGHAPYEHELRLRMPDGRVKYLNTVGQVIRNQDGRLENLGATQDVTQRRLAEAALDKLRSELAHVTRINNVGALTASIAHEVSQPILGIVTNASTCLRMLDADPPNLDGARETARRTIRDGDRASEIVARLRAMFSRKEFTPDSLDLNEAVREVITLFLSELQRNHVVLQSELAEDLPVITGDRLQLQQVIMNLLRNGSDAMADVHDRSRLLLIRTEREGDDRVRLSVRDAGVGLPPQNTSAVFEAFYTTKSGGVGIGLFVSRSIVEKHHGRLWAEPNDGPGATFVLSIPCGQAGARGTVHAPTIT